MKHKLKKLFGKVLKLLGTVLSKLAYLLMAGSLAATKHSKKFK